MKVLVCRFSETPETGKFSLTNDLKKTEVINFLTFKNEHMH